MWNTRKARTFLTVVAVGVIVAAPAMALANDFAGKLRTGPLIDAFRGGQKIHTDPATVNGVSYVHTNQVGFDAADHWIAIGSYKGAGNSGGCPNDYGALGSRWSAFVDGRLSSGIYFCTGVDVDAFGGPSNPSIRIEHLSSCPNNPAQQGWALYMGGLYYFCAQTLGDSYTVGRDASGALETVGSNGVCRNIDVTFRDLNVREYVGGNWVPFGYGAGVADTGTGPHCASYSIDQPSTAEFTARLGALG